MTRLAQGGPALSARVRRMTTVLLLAACGIAAASPDEEPLGVRTPGSLRDLFLDVVQWMRAPSPRSGSTWMGHGQRLEHAHHAHADGKVVQVRLDEQADSLTAAIRLPWGVFWGLRRGRSCAGSRPRSRSGDGALGRVERPGHRRLAPGLRLQRLRPAHLPGERGPPGAPPASARAR